MLPALTEGASIVGSFYCNGRSPARRQAWDHPKAALAWHLAKTCPFREIQVAGYAHLHTTLNKSRDEKLKSCRVGRTNDFGERAGVMGWHRTTEKQSPSKMAPPPGLEPGTYRLTAERSAN